MWWYGGSTQPTTFSASTNSCADADRAADEQIAMLLAENARLRALLDD